MESDGGGSVEEVCFYGQPSHDSDLNMNEQKKLAPSESFLWLSLIEKFPPPDDDADSSPGDFIAIEKIQYHQQGIAVYGGPIIKEQKVVYLCFCGSTAYPLAHSFSRGTV